MSMIIKDPVLLTRIMFSDEVIFEFYGDIKCDIKSPYPEIASRYTQ